MRAIPFGLFAQAQELHEEPHLARRSAYFLPNVVGRRQGF